MTMPDRTWTSDIWGPRCPWCRQDIDDVAVTLADLTAAWVERSATGKGNWLYRERPFNGIPAACNACGKAILVKLVVDDGDRRMIVAGVRTEADQRLLAGEA
jgi:hypothetical protein